MNVTNGITYTIPSDFVVRANKQKTLIDILLKYSQLQLEDLAKLLNISTKKMQVVVKGKSYFNKEEIEKLVQYFCICFGD